MSIPPRDTDRTPVSAVAFVRARLDEEEAIARRAAEPFLHGDRTGLDGLHPMVLVHARHWSTARVLQQVDLLRHIVDAGDHLTVARLALIWHDHPDHPGFWQDPRVGAA